jgi:hypothetical protein
VSGNRALSAVDLDAMAAVVEAELPAKLTGPLQSLALPSALDPATRKENMTTYQPTTNQPASTERRGTLTGAEGFWYVLGCIAMGANYFAKVPAKKALTEYGYGTMTGAEKFWYVMMCIAFGAGYFAKLPVKKALTESVPLGH